MASDRIRQHRTKKTVILDANAIIMLFEYNINLEEELKRLVGSYKIIIPRPIINELKILSTKGKGKKRINAKASLKLIEKYEIVESDEKNADDSVFSTAEKTKSTVVTNDKELKIRLKHISIPVIYLRAKKKLEIT